MKIWIFFLLNKTGTIAMLTEYFINDKRPSLDD